MTSKASRSQIAELESRTAQPGFWEKQAVARETLAEIKELKRMVDRLTRFQSEVDDLNTLLELVDEAGGEEDGKFSEEVRQSAGKVDRFHR